MFQITHIGNINCAGLGEENPLYWLFGSQVAGGFLPLKYWGGAGGGQGKEIARSERHYNHNKDELVTSIATLCLLNNKSMQTEVNDS